MAGLIIESLESRSVDWLSVHDFVVPLLNEVGCWPMAGTLTWQNLTDDDPVKVAAIFDAARHHTLRVETAQAALAQASRDISASADWSAVSRAIRRRNCVYIPRRTA
jgi:Protein of unknown function (DUF2742)